MLAGASDSWCVRGPVLGLTRTCGLRCAVVQLLRRYPGAVADAPKVVTAEELDQMSPDERAQIVRDHIVTELDQLPDGFRRRVETTAARLAEQIRPTTG